MAEVQCQSQRLILEDIINKLNGENSKEDITFIITATIKALENKYKWSKNKLSDISRLSAKYNQYRGLKYIDICEEVLNNFIEDVNLIVD